MIPKELVNNSDSSIILDCDKCDEIFENYGHYKKHDHPQKYKYYCTICDFKRFTKDGIENHLKNYHDINQFIEDYYSLE